MVEVWADFLVSYVAVTYFWKFFGQMLFQLDNEDFNEINDLFSLSDSRLTVVKACESIRGIKNSYRI